MYKVLIAALLLLGFCSNESQACGWWPHRVTVVQPVEYVYPVVVVQPPVTVYYPVYTYGPYVPYVPYRY